MSEEVKLKIVCAANRHRGDGRIVCSARHWDEVMRSQVSNLIPSEWEQGFMDQFCNWHTREEAYLVVQSSGQFFDPVSNSHDTKLFSEGLY